MITTGGLLGTLEAFSASVPTSFLPSLNLSQYALVRVLKKFGACPQSMDWNEYTKINEDLGNLSEGSAIMEMGRYAKIVDENENLCAKFVEDFSRMALVVPNDAEQKKFSAYVGSSGADEIVDILKERWELF